MTFQHPALSKIDSGGLRFCRLCCSAIAYNQGRRHLAKCHGIGTWPRLTQRQHSYCKKHFSEAKI